MRTRCYSRSQQLAPHAGEPAHAALNFSAPADLQRHPRLLVLVQRILSLHRHPSAAHTPSEQFVGWVEGVPSFIYFIYNPSPKPNTPSS